LAERIEVRDTVFRIIAAAGLFLLITGTALFPVSSAERETPGVLFAVGAVLLVVSALANLKSVVAFFRQRQARQGANAVLMTLLFTAILVIIQAISIRNTHRYDVTRNQRFTLSEQTQSLLEQLDGDIVFTAFLRKHTNQWQGGEALLNMYMHHGRNVRFEMIDPDEKPHVAERYRAKSGEVIVEYKENLRKADGLSEEKITNALLFASRERQKTVYFVTGHDEKRLDSGEGDGLRFARQGLENTGFLTRELSLVEVDSIPPDCAVLVLAGPKKEYLQSEVNHIDNFLARGGSVLFLLDPRWPISHMQLILDRYYVVAFDYVLLDELVVDAGEEMFDATYTKIRNYNTHPITRGFRSITIFPMARPLAIEPNESDLAIRTQYLAITGKSAWGETDMNSFRAGSAIRDETDLAPPLGVAVVAERTNRYDGPSGRPPEREWTSKIVVVGDSDFATNRFYRLLGNSDFFLNAIEYLAEEEIVIPIRPKKSLGDRVYISASEGRLIFVLCLVSLPLMVASLGGYVLMRKRRT
jgi:ABC-type uncharacterized transport system involved in gliding motility auxiliary subunit